MQNVSLHISVGLLKVCFFLLWLLLSSLLLLLLLLLLLVAAIAPAIVVPAAAIAAPAAASAAPAIVSAAPAVVCVAEVASDGPAVAACADAPPRVQSLLGHQLASSVLESILCLQLGSVSCHYCISGHLEGTGVKIRHYTETRVLHVSRYVKKM